MIRAGRPLTPLRGSPNRRFLTQAGLAASLLGLGASIYWLYYSWWLTGDPFSYPDPRKGMFSAPNEMNAAILWALGLADPTGQHLAHQGMVLALVGLCAAGPWHRRTHPVVGTVAKWVSRGGLALAVVVLPVLLFPRTGAGGAALLFGAVGTAALVWRGRILDSPRLHVAVAALIALVWGALFIPGIWMRPDFSYLRWYDIEALQYHWAQIFGPVGRLLDGLPLYTAVRPHYGALTMLSAVAIEPLSGRFTLLDYLRYSCFLQGVYLAVALLGYRYVAKGRWHLCLVPMLLVGLQYHFAAWITAWPNHTAWRYIWFPVAILAQIMVRRTRTPVVAAVLGVSSMLGVIQNTESGVAVAAGHAVFLGFVLMHRRHGSPPARILPVVFCYLAGCGAAVGAFALTNHWLLGSWPALGDFPNVWSYLTLAAMSGLDSGLLGRLDPLALLIFGHACYALLTACAVTARGYSTRLALRASVATMIIVWFAYYANRPHPEYLPCYFVLYGYLLVDQLRVVVAARRLPGMWAPAAACLLTGAIVIPRLIVGIEQELPAYRRGLELVLGASPAAPATVIDGVYFPEEPHAAGRRERAAFLRSLPEAAMPVYLTADSYLTRRLVGVWPTIATADSFWGSEDRSRYQRLLDDLFRSSPSRLYVDLDSLALPADFDNTTNARIAFAKRFFFQHLRADLGARYDVEETRAGWLILKLRAPA